MLSVVGGALVLGKPFQLMCHSNNGTLPIDYTLYGPYKFTAKEMVTTAEERAVFNVSAIHTSAKINDFLCHASNSKRRKEETGHVLRSTMIIGASLLEHVEQQKKQKVEPWVACQIFI